MKFAIKGTVLALGALVGMTAFADKAAYDGFETADLGALDGQIGGTGFSGAYTANGALTVIKRSLVYEKGTLKIDGGKQALQMKRSTVENENVLGSRPLAETHAEDVFYVSALVYVDKNTKSSGNRDTYWVGLAAAVGSAPTGGLGVEDTAYKWSGIVGGQSRLSSVVVDYASPHFIVAKIHKNTKGETGKYDRVSLMVDPESADEPTTWTMSNQNSGSSTTYSEMSALSFYMKYDRAEPADTVLFDEIRVGTTWADVVVPYKEEPVIETSTVHWTGADEASNDWSATGNWAEEKLPDTNDVVFTNADAADWTEANSQITDDITVNSLAFEHQYQDGADVIRHILSIAEDRTLTVTGTNEFGQAFCLAGQATEAGSICSTRVEMMGGGSLVIDSQDGIFGAGLGFADPLNAMTAGSLTLRGLSSLSADVDRFLLGYGPRTRANVSLPTNGVGETTIRANYVAVGDSAGTLGRPGTTTLTLGPSTVVHAARINVGATEVSGSTDRNNDVNGEVRFAAGLENPTLTVRSRGGMGRADMTVASHGNGKDNWYVIRSEADFSGGTVDMLLGELLVGFGSGYNGTQQGSVTGIFTMDDGVVDANKILLGRSAYFAGGRKHNDSYPALGRYVMRGGETVVREAVELGVSMYSNWQGGRQVPKGYIDLSGDARFTALGPVTLAADGGYATGAVARVTLEDESVFVACAGLRNGQRVTGKKDNNVEIVVAEFDGSVFVNGGVLAVTNETETSELCLDYGTLSVTGGSVLADRLTMTNAESVVELAVNGKDPPIAVNGTANVGGGVLRVTLPGEATADRNGNYLLIAAESVVGRFATVEAPRGMKIRYTSRGVVGSYGGLVLILR